MRVGFVEETKIGRKEKVMTSPGHRAASWRSPRTEIRESGVEGRGVFAINRIEKDEIVAVKGGHIVDHTTLVANRAIVGESEIQIADGLYLAPLDASETEAVMMFLNHSCEPNAGVMGNILFVAMKTIEPGEEVTIDYAMIDDGEFAMECSCRAASCRGTVRGKDWQREDLQARYGAYFSAFLRAKF